MADPGWYLDPADQTRERYFNGYQFIDSSRPAEPGALSLPAGSAKVSPPPARQSADGLRTAAGVLWFLVLLGIVGAVVVGAYLLTRTACVVNPYDASLCMGSTHPYIGAGLGALAGGLVQAVVAGIVARLCTVVADMRSGARQPVAA